MRAFTLIFLAFLSLSSQASTIDVFAKKFSKLDAYTQIQRVNAAVNHQIFYTSDFNQYGKKEHWAGPAKTWLSRKGDCEEFVMVKHEMLRSLGFEKMKFLPVKVQGQGHLLLIVRKNNKEVYVLDNMTNQIKVIKATEKQLAKLASPAQMMKSKMSA